MLTFIALILWITLPALAALQLWRMGLPRAGLLALVLGVAIILLAAATEALDPPTNHQSLLNLGFVYIAISGAAFISYGRNAGWQKLVFALGFWSAHIGIGLLLALGSAGSLLPGLSQSDLPAWAGSLPQLHSAAAALSLLGILTMTVFALFALVQVVRRKPLP